MKNIEFALEVPVAYLEDLTGLVDFHFCIATTAAQHRQYLLYYAEQAELYRRGESNKMVMLDNGAHEAFSQGETKPPLTVSELYDLTLSIRPQMVWAPDKLFDDKQTGELSFAFRDKMLLYNEQFDNRKHRIAVGFIPQARTAEALVDLLLADFDLYDWIGFSFHNDRDMILRLLGRKLLWFRHVHMLGLNDLRELKLWPRIPLTVDTSKPIKGAMHGLHLQDVKRGLGLMMPTDKLAYPHDYKLMISNIDKLRKACSGESV